MLLSPSTLISKKSVISCWDLGLVFQFIFLVITEKNICLQTFFVIKYFRFWFTFYVKTALQPSLKKFTTSFPATPV